MTGADGRHDGLAGARLGRALAAALAMLAIGLAPVLAKEYVEIIHAEMEIPEEMLLDVGIEIFDPGLPEDDEHALEDKGVFPEVRKAEARFFPYHLKSTMEATGHWGAVRVVPPGIRGLDLTVSGEILESTGMDLAVRVHVVDARGRVWRDRRYRGEADAGAYQEDRIEDRDPYQSLYNEIANDILEVRERRDEEEIREIRELSRLRFAADLAPTAFGDYIEVNKRKRASIEKLPAPDDPMMARVARVRQRDDMFVDTLNEYYAEFYLRMGEPYESWRQYSYEEQLALQKIRRQARKRKFLAGLMILGGAVVDSSSDVGSATRDAAIIGGVLTMQSGIDKAKEAKIHKEALKELAASFDAEIEPLLVEVEGRTLRLEGSAETQYAEWRRLLAQIFAEETGLPLDPDDPDRMAPGAEGID
jgi:hypothetical protein